MFDFIDIIRDFLDKGGQVLWLIMFTTLLLWTFILERYLFFKTTYPHYAKNLHAKWMARSDRSSWWAHRIRDKMISEAKIELNQFIPFIKTLVALCPLLGLLGTVTGMIAVFDVMALTGTGNARMMASGISMATIPTMAGMVASLSGLYLGSHLEKKAKREAENVAESLAFQ